MKTTTLEREQWKSELPDSYKEVRDIAWDLLDDHDTQAAEIDALRAERKRIREALSFYADRKNYFECMPGAPESPELWDENPICAYEKREYRHAAWWKSDDGDRARDALEEKTK